MAVSYGDVDHLSCYVSIGSHDVLYVRLRKSIVTESAIQLLYLEERYKEYNRIIKTGSRDKNE
jgi:hypothetical protein